MASFIERKVEEIRKTVGRGKVVCGLSGGVDSLVTSLIVHKAVGSRLTCIFVDNGLLRKNSSTNSWKISAGKFRSSRSSAWTPAGNSSRKLRGVTSPEENESRSAPSSSTSSIGGRPDRRAPDSWPRERSIPTSSKAIRSRAFPCHQIASQRGGPAEGLKFTLIEPLRELFKDEVRAWAVKLGLDTISSTSIPFPGPGLAVRLLGAVDRESLDILRDADDILLQEVRRAGIYRKMCRRSPFSFRSGRWASWATSGLTRRSSSFASSGARTA